VGPIHLHDGQVRALAFSEDGTQIASGGQDGVVSVVDADTGELVSGPSTSGPEISDMLWDGDRLVTGDADGRVLIWNGAALEGEMGPGPDTGGVTDMALSDDGTLAVADRAGFVGLWNLDERRLQGEPLRADDTTIWGLAWSTDGTTLATASDDVVVTLWDVGSRQPVGSLTPQPGGARSVSFLGDGATIVTTTYDGSVRLWDTHEMVPLGGPLPGHEAAVWRSVALPGMRFATSSQDGTVRIWDMLNPERACERARGPLGLSALGSILGEDQEPIACDAS
jgi:WD40 repeat protein